MSVLKDARNLILGNGDVFFSPSGLSGLPSIATYKSAFASGGLPALSGNQGAVKGTVEMQIVRESTPFEIGTPLEVAAQAVIREGIHFKCNLAELSMSAVYALIGGGNYSTADAGVTAVTPAEPVTLSTLVGYPLAHGPVLYTDSVTPAANNPCLALSGGGVTGASVPATATATGTGMLTISGAGNVLNAAGVTVTVGGTYADGQVYTLKIGNLYTVSYTSQSGDTNNTGAAAGLVKAITAVTGVGVVSNKFVATSFTATNSGAVITVTEIFALQGYDFIIDAVNDVVTLTGTGWATSGAYQLLYSYLEYGSETLSVGGQSILNQTAIRFFHPYADAGRVLCLTVYKANPTGSLTIPFEESAWTHTAIEFRSVSDFTRSVGDHQFNIYRDVPQ